MNALAALAAAHAVGVDVATALPALAQFRSVKRRLEVIGQADGVTIYDDFAHHPTAIATTLAGLRAKVGDARIVVAMEPRSNSMRLGAHADALAPSLDIADAVVFLHRPELAWDAGKVVGALRGEGVAVPDADALIAALREACATRRPCRVHVQRRLRRRPAPFPGSAATRLKAARAVLACARKRFTLTAMPQCLADRAARVVSAAHRAGAWRVAGPARVRAALPRPGPRLRACRQGFWRVPDPRWRGSRRTRIRGGLWHRGVDRRLRQRRRRPADPAACGARVASTPSAYGCATTACRSPT